jgi:hypothetical protein
MLEAETIIEAQIDEQESNPISASLLGEVSQN